MNKKALVIGANIDSVHTIENAHKHNIFVVAVDGNPNARGFEYADKAINVDISDVDAVCKVVEEEKPDFILTVPIGRYISTIGYVNSKYNLKGINFEATELSSDKYLFHKKLNENGLRHIKLYLINKDTDFEKISIPYPAIMKPRFGSGSRDVYYITNDDELKKAYDKVISLDEDFVLEEAFQGTEYGVDLAVVDNEVHLVLVRGKSMTPLPERQEVAYFSTTRDSENAELTEKIKEKLEKVLGVLKYNDCLVNADVMVSDDGKDVNIIEIAPRPSGHNLHNLLTPISTGVDVSDEFIKFLIGEKYNFEPSEIKQTEIHYFDFEDRVISKVPSLEDLQENKDLNILAWECNIKDGDYMCKVTDGHSVMHRGFFVIEGKSRADLESQTSYILSQFI